MLTAFTVGMVPPLLPLLAAEWQLSPLQVGLVNTLYAVGRLGTSYPASALRARHGTRAVVFVGLALLVLGVVACGLAPGFLAFLVARLVMGIGASAAFLAIFAELLETDAGRLAGPPHERLRGHGDPEPRIGSTLGAWIAGAVGWRWVFVGAGPVLLLCGLAWRGLGSEAGRRAARPAALRSAGGRAAHRRLLPVYGAEPEPLDDVVGPLRDPGAAARRREIRALARAPSASRWAPGTRRSWPGSSGSGSSSTGSAASPSSSAGALAVALGGLVLAAGTHPAVFVLGLVLVGGGFAVWMVPAIVLADRVGTPMPPGYFAVYRIAMDAGMIAGPARARRRRRPRRRPGGRRKRGARPGRRGPGPRPRPALKPADPDAILRP